MKSTLVRSRFSISKIFGAISLLAAIAQAIVYACTKNGVHLNSTFITAVAVLTTAIAWFSRSPFSQELGIEGQTGAAPLSTTAPSIETTPHS
jgi:hypothetical protein